MIGKREWEDLREATRPLDNVITVLRDDKVVEAMALHDANPDMTDQLIHLIGERRRQLVSEYPTSVPMTPLGYWPSKNTRN